MPNPQTSQAVQDEMVAYLDGELSAVQMQRVEDRLARDPAYRRQLQRLQRAWECLDQLPRSHVEEQFARSTVEMVAVQAERETASQTAATAHPRWKSTLIVLAVAAAAALVGAIGARVIRSRGNAASRQPATEAAAGGSLHGVPLKSETEGVANQLAPADQPVLRRWVARHLVNSSAARRVQSRLSRLPGYPAARDQADSTRPGPSSRPVRRVFQLLLDPRADAAFRSLVDNHALDDLKQHLSAPSRAALNAAGGLQQQQDRVRDWIRIMFFEHVQGPNDFRSVRDVSHGELERFFSEDLPRGERVRLMAMPRDAMQDELKRLYLRENGPRRRETPPDR